MKNIVKVSRIIVICMFLVGCTNASNGVELFSSEYSAEETEKESQSVPDTDLTEEGVEEQNPGVVVYLCGEVCNPGIYELPKGSRISDAVTLAGGLTENASPDYWNLAQILTDGEMISFPTKEEAKERDSVVPEAESKININSATLEQLLTLSGIGEAKGKAILSYREEHGSFSKKEDLLNVSGIGSAVLEKIKDDIMVD